MSQQRVMVVGGGVIGAACAYYLAQRGWQVTILERARFGEGCSHANCGLVVLSHVLPLNEAGLPTRTLLTMFRKDSPFHVKLGFDPGLWMWLLRFARNCRERAVLESAHALAALLGSSGELYQDLLQDDALTCEWQQQGCLSVYRTKIELDRFAKKADRLRETFGLPSTRYNGDAVAAFEPALKQGLAGGWHFGMDSHLRPEKLMASWRETLGRLNVTIREQCEVQDFVATGGRCRAVKTAREELPADAFVVAAGAWTPRLAAAFGCRVPIQPGKGYSVTMPRPGICPRVPLLLQEHGVAVTPFPSGYRLGSTMEFAGYDRKLERRRLQVLLAAAEVYLEDPYREPWEEEWFGWRPMTYDGKPIIGAVPAMNNVYLAAGHNMLGVTMAPATGKLVAELVNDEQPHIDPAPFSPTRF